VFDTAMRLRSLRKWPGVPYVVGRHAGARDLQALRRLALGPRYVRARGRRRKATVLKESLRAAGADLAAVEAIVAPAGYPIAASTPER